jgi:hypothetical protein
MHPIEPAHISYPYCGEPLEIIIDSSVRRQEYIEYCQADEAWYQGHPEAAPMISKN